MNTENKNLNEKETIPVSVLILSYNEEKNIGACIESVYGWVRDIHLVDSYSTDSTLETARRYTDNIRSHEFESYSRQRNWALENIEFRTQWVLNLDADHRVSPELRDELIDFFKSGKDRDIDGFLISRKTVFMGRWIRHGGHFPVYHSMMFKRSRGYCEDRLYDQHFVVEGRLEYLKGNVIDIITDSLTHFTDRHNRWATLEALEFLSNREGGGERKIKADSFGHAIERRRYLRKSYNRLPLFLRPFLYFLYRYFVRLGFLDGKEGLVFHFLQGFWYRFLVDSKVYEIRLMTRKENISPLDAVKELYGEDIISEK